jgi:carbon monoxide dehydrogenase subunit G
MRSACSVKTLYKSVALVLLAALAAAAWGADDLAVDVDRNGSSFAIRAATTVAAPASLVWEVLTDYNNLSRFIPGMSRSLVELRVANRVLVEQKGEARFLVFSYPIEVRLEVQEKPRDWITSRAVGGNLKRMNGRYDLHPQGTHLRLSYSGVMEPEFELPPVIGTLAVRGMVEEQFAALVAEIERRASLPR